MTTQLHPLPEGSFSPLRSPQAAPCACLHQQPRHPLLLTFTRNIPALLSLLFLVVIGLAVLLAPLSPYDPNKLNLAAKFAPASAQHLFGCDAYGRDIFTRILYGGRISLLVGVCSMAVTLCIGTVIGIFSGYVGGIPDQIIMRLTDIFLALPSMLLMIVLNTLLKPGIPTLILVLSLFSWASVARITRAETLSLKQRDFVAASHNLGAGGLFVTLHHILPNIAGPVIVSASLGIASAILTESSLSFLGLGISIPHASWGSMLQEAQSYILDQPQLAVYPGLFILLTVVSFNLLGDALRSALDPKPV